MSAGTSSVLPNNTYANPIQELWAPAGAGGGGAGVTQIVAGNNITISPADGEGVVTINASGGGAPSGVTELVAGNGITISAPTGVVTVSANGSFPPGDITINGSLTCDPLIAGRAFLNNELKVTNLANPNIIPADPVVVVGIAGSKALVSVEPGAIGGFNMTSFNVGSVQNPRQQVVVVNAYDSIQGPGSLNFTWDSGNSAGLYVVRIRNNDTVRRTYVIAVF